MLVLQASMYFEMENDKSYVVENSKHFLSPIITAGEYQKMAKKLIQIQFEFF